MLLTSVSISAIETAQRIAVFNFSDLRMGKKTNELPVLDNSPVTIRVDIKTEKAFAIHLAEKEGTSRMANVNNRKARVLACRLLGQTTLEVELQFFDFMAIRKV